MAEVFRHERLLNVRELQLQLKAVDLRNLEDEHRRRQDLLDNLRLVKQTHLKKDEPFLLLEHEGLSSRDLQVLVWYTQQLNAELQAGLSEVRQATDEVARQRTVVEKAVVDKRILEKLKTRHLLRAQLEESHRDQIINDEVAARQYLANKNTVNS
ncbi:MAG: hypothetical protein KAU50_08865 [Candidatus Marinimicrobia bacterium]|nr:hypothetical protein [Candidatus Neomarinimicrobiota bacterium]